MSLKRKTAVIGTAILAQPGDDPRSLEELLYDVVQDALRDADLTIEDIDGIVVGSNDQFDGRAISIMAASGSVGGVDRDILSTPSASEHALVMATLRIASGLYETHLIVSWSTTEASSLSEAQRLGADPYFHRRLPLDENAGTALQANVMASSVPGLNDLAAKLAANTRSNGARTRSSVSLKGGALGKLPYPLTDEMVTAPVTGAVAMVIASEDYVAENNLTGVAWINGMGWATETGYLGDRNLNEALALEVARDRAYGEAGLTSPLTQIDVAELTDVSPYQELMVSDVLGLSARADWETDVASGLFSADSNLPVNPSGGVLCFNPVFCTGLIRISEAANQIRGCAGKHQVSGAKTALAHAASGFAMMYQCVLILGAEPTGEIA
jgi:acetyl-CoA C-acetyltransferase